MTEPVLRICVTGKPAPQGSMKHIGKGRLVPQVGRVKGWRASVRGIASSLESGSRSKPVRSLLLVGLIVTRMNSEDGMKKIPTLYVRDESNPARVTEEVHPDCKWVLDGEGVATEKIDGTAVLIRNGEMFARHTVKAGGIPPLLWMHHDLTKIHYPPEDQPLRMEEKTPGWRQCTKHDKSDRSHIEAHELGWQGGIAWPDGTYELVGPKVQGNPYKLERHELWKHGARPVMVDLSRFRTQIGLQAVLRGLYLEGIVWHHPDGRMAKIKRRDFGIPWPA